MHAMALSGRIARPLLGATFIASGVEALRDPRGPGPRRPVPPWLAGRVADPDALVRANGALQVGAGALLACGRLPRLAPLVLLASIVPQTCAGHRYWDEDRATAAGARFQDVLHKAGVAGALLMAAVEPVGTRRDAAPGRRGVPPHGPVVSTLQREAA
jgi:uncharacterized membrane protein YphA (DoxX/SURF4 family)